MLFAVQQMFAYNFPAMAPIYLARPIDSFKVQLVSPSVEGSVGGGGAGRTLIINSVCQFLQVF